MAPRVSAGAGEKPYGDVPIGGMADAVMLAGLACLLAASRFWLGGVGVAPDPTVLVHHWQHLPLAALAADPLLPFTGLRSQPPLWNAVIATAAVICEARLDCVVRELHGVNVALTGIAAGAFHAGLRLSGLSAARAGLAAAVVVLSPSTVFYETYLFYPHLTMALAAIAFVGATLLARERSARAYAGAVAPVAGLALTVTLYHPVFVALFAAMALPAVRRQRLRAAAAAGVLLVLAAGAPAIRNAAEIGIFANGTWAGLNLVQTAPGVPDDVRQACWFQTLLFDGGMSAGRPEGEILNDAAVAHVSRQVCMPAALSAIRDDPAAWVSGIGMRMVGSHLLHPYHYTFRPIGFEAVPQVPSWEETLARTLQDGVIATFPAYAMLVAGVLYYPAVASAGLVLALRHRREPAGIVAALVLALIVWQTVVSHAANGWEQERMRYTLEPLYGALAVLALHRLVRRALHRS